jgi:AcrR family transcriptional regulator
LSTPAPDLERDRIRLALIALVAERGYLDTSLEAVLDRAGTDHAGFARRYRDLDACFAEIWEEHKQEFLRVTAKAFASRSRWRDGMRAAAWAFCRFLQSDPDRARFFLVDFYFAGEAVQASRDVVMSRYADLIDRGNEERPDASVPRAHAEAIMGAIWEGAVGRIRAEDFDGIPEAIPQAMYLTVLPYLGPEAAREELRRGPADIGRYRRGEI